MDKKVLVIVVTCNGMRWMDRTLGSLRKSAMPVDVLVVDNASIDSTPEYVASAFPESEVISLDLDRGYAAACNMGLQIMLERHYTHAVLLDQYCWVEKDTIERLCRAWREGYGLMSPELVSASGELFRPYGRMCGKKVGEMTRTFSKENLVVDVSGMPAGLWMVSREALETVGLLSVGTDRYDTVRDYVGRLASGGLGIAIVPAAVCTCNPAEDEGEIAKAYRRCFSPLHNLRRHLGQCKKNI